MIVISKIKQNIEQLERLYNNSSNQRKEFFYSKLAILELCGWIEETMDKIVKTYSNRKIKDSGNRKRLEEFIQQTYSFEYKKFRQILIQVVGIVGIERLEKKLDRLKLARLQSTLGTLKKPRDIQAHTYTNTMTTIDSPSVIISKLAFLREGLEEIEKKIKKLKC